MTVTSYASAAHFGDYGPADFGWAARDPERDSSLLVPFSHSGVTFGSMHRDVVGLFTALLDELVPLIPGGLVAGQCGCYNPASVTVGGDRSFHTYAIAIDVNWGSNPMYAPAHPTGPHTLPSAASAIAARYGCEWGGDWSYPQDWMHIECHLTPDAARAVTPLGKDWLNMATKEEVQAAVTDALDAYLHSTKGTKRLQEIVLSQVRKFFLPYTGAPIPWRAATLVRLGLQRGPLGYDPNPATKPAAK